MMLTKETVKPSDFDTRFSRWGDTPFNNREMEIMACNIVILSIKNDDQWIEFDWPMFVDMCDCHVGEKEHHMLKTFVKKGYLAYKRGMYSIRDKFIVDSALMRKIKIDSIFHD